MSGQQIAGRVALTWSEVLYVGNAALMRAVSGQRDARAFEQGRNDFGFERHLIGALGEYAVAKHLNVHFAPAIGRLDTDDRDVAGYQIRCTTHPSGKLIVKRDARPSDPYVLVRLALIGAEPHADVCGWMLAGDAMQERYWRSEGVHHPAYFVPVADLEARA